MKSGLSFYEYWHILLKRRWIVMITSLTFIGFLYYYTQTQNPIFQATTYVRVDQYKTVVNVISDLLRWSPGEIMSTEVETITSPEVMKTAAEELGLIPKGADEYKYYAKLADLKESIHAEVVPDTNMISISVISSDRNEVARIANTVTNVYIDVTHQKKLRDIQSSRLFIQDQLDQAFERLSASEEKLRNFKQQHGTLSVDSETSLTLDRMTSFEGELIRLRSERTSLEWDIFRMQDKLLEPVLHDEFAPEITTSPAVNSYSSALDDVRREIETLLKTQTETNPDVQALRRREASLETMLSQSIRKSLEIKLHEYNEKIDEVSQRENDLSNMIKKELIEIPEKDLQLSQLTREVTVNEEMYMLLNKEFKEAQIREKGMINEVSLVSLANPPKTPIKPNKRLILIVGVFVGLATGLLMAILFESFDMSLGAIEDIEKFLGIPVLATIPHFGQTPGRHNKVIGSISKSLGTAPRLPTLFDPSAIEAEAYRHLRTNLLYARRESNRKVFMVTSSGSQEGKSVTISNLAVTLAQSGLKTLLVGCNLRRPTVYKLFDLERQPGLADILSGQCSVSEAMRTIADNISDDPKWDKAGKLYGMNNLFIIPAGTLPMNPAELLGSQAMADFVKSVRQEFDIILLDTPPILPVTDTYLVGQQADGALLIYKIGHLPRNVLMRAKDQMKSLGIHISGVVLNDVRPEFQGVTPIYISKEYHSATRKILQGAAKNGNTDDS